MREPVPPFIEPKCPTCGRPAGQACVNTRHGDYLQHPHPSRALVLIAALREDNAHLRDLLEAQQCVN